MLDTSSLPYTRAVRCTIRRHRAPRRAATCPAAALPCAAGRAAPGRPTVRVPVPCVPCGGRACGAGAARRYCKQYPTKRSISPRAAPAARRQDKNKRRRNCTTAARRRRYSGAPRVAGPVTLRRRGPMADWATVHSHNATTYRGRAELQAPHERQTDEKAPNWTPPHSSRSRCT